MAHTFSIKPSKSFSLSSKPRVVTSQFGDGYSQRIVNGINNIAKEWSVSFNSRDLQTISQIENFFEARRGVEGFRWIPPGDTTIYSVLCTEWSKTYDSHISASITAKFIQIFDVLV